MASELFENLFARAIQRDCPLLSIISNTGHLASPGAMLDGKPSTMFELASKLLEAWYEFNNRFHSVMVRRGLPAHKTSMLCEICGRADCPNAKPYYVTTHLVL